MWCLTRAKDLIFLMFLAIRSEILGTTAEEWRYSEYISRAFKTFDEMRWFMGEIFLQSRNYHFIKGEQFRIIFEI